ncbi:MAG: YihY/virulence factor BrkB family protein [Pseudomonadota bacterium]
MTDPAKDLPERACSPVPSSTWAFGWRDWWAVALGTTKAMGNNELTLIAAGVAFYGFLAIFPMLGALFALYGFVSDPATIRGHLDSVADWAPPGAHQIIVRQIEEIASAGRKALGYASLLSVALMLWTAKAGVSALMRGLNIVFRVPEKRGFITGMAAAYAMTAALIVVALVALAAVVVIPGLIAAFPVTTVGAAAAAFARWPIALAAVLFGVGLLYRYGPAEMRPRFSWISAGALLAIALWLAGSTGFSWYVANFANYNSTYGSLGAMVGLLMWLYLSALIILLGAEVNAEIERRCGLAPPLPDPASAQKAAAGERKLATALAAGRAGAVE